MYEIVLYYAETCIKYAFFVFDINKFPLYALCIASLKAMWRSGDGRYVIARLLISSTTIRRDEKVSYVFIPRTHLLLSFWSRLINLFFHLYNVILSFLLFMFFYYSRMNIYYLLRCIIVFHLFSLILFYTL